MFDLKNNQLGSCIHQEQDEYGSVVVYEKHKQRYLTFGNAVEQSCMNLQNPAQLAHVYTQAMMLSLLLMPDASSALLLGLGGGSLVRALQKLRPKMHIHAVEYRPAVIQVAKDWFDITEHKHLKLYCDDATQFVENNDKQYDLIFSDLYLAEGVHEAQTQAAFIAKASEHLTGNGIFMVNRWCDDYQATEQTRRALSETFDNRLLSLQVEGGNIITFAFHGDFPNFDRKQFFVNAQQLGMQLDIPLQKLARDFWSQNAQPLKISRFITR